MKVENRDRVSALNKELKKVQTVGHIIKTSPLSSAEEYRSGIGVELFLDTRITPPQIRKIVHYIVDKYNFDSYYYTKTHSIKVWYKNVR